MGHLRRAFVALQNTVQGGSEETGECLKSDNGALGSDRASGPSAGRSEVDTGFEIFDAQSQ